jgi:hypothetical protein
MKCYVESCLEPAVFHITEMINEIPDECHVCHNHVEEYFGGIEEFKNQYREHMPQLGAMAHPLSARPDRGGRAGHAGLEVSKRQHKQEPTPIPIPQLVAWISGCFGILSDNKAEEVILPLIEQLRVEASSIRLTAALVLGEVGRGNNEVIAALQKALIDSNEQVREAAYWALEKQRRQAPKDP